MTTATQCRVFASPRDSPWLPGSGRPVWRQRPWLSSESAIRSSLQPIASYLVRAPTPARLQDRPALIRWSLSQPTGTTWPTTASATVPRLGLLACPGERPGQRHRCVRQLVHAFEDRCPEVIVDIQVRLRAVDEPRNDETAKVKHQAVREPDR